MYTEIQEKVRWRAITIEDAERKINAAIFSQKLAQTSEQLVLDEVVVISGKINKDFRELVASCCR